MDSSTLYLLILILSVVILGVAAFSKLLRRSIVSGPLVTMVIGFLLSPQVFDVFDLSKWGEQNAILQEAARLTLAIGLMGNALQLPKWDFLKRKRAILTLIGLLMPLMWLATSALIFAIASVPILVALLIGAVLTPTDPILARTIIQGDLAEEKIPTRIRSILLEESGFNDGLAYPFVLLPALLLISSPSDAFSEWLVHDVLWAVLGAVVLGIIIGFATGKLLHWGHKRQIIEKPFFFAYPVALSLLSLSAGRILKVDGILAVFIAGLAFAANLTPEEEFEDEAIQSSVDRFFSLPIFFLFGLVMPWEGWLELGWKAPALVVSILLLRRIPFVLILQRLLNRQIKSTQENLFYGWFGPMGVSAIFYAMLALHESGQPEPWIIGSLVVAASVVAYAVTGAPFTKRLKAVEEE